MQRLVVSINKGTFLREIYLHCHRTQKRKYLQSFNQQKSYIFARPYVKKFLIKQSNINNQSLLTPLMQDCTPKESRSRDISEKPPSDFFNVSLSVSFLWRPESPFLQGSGCCSWPLSRWVREFTGGPGTIFCRRHIPVIRQQTRLWNARSFVRNFLSHIYFSNSIRDIWKFVQKLESFQISLESFKSLWRG